MMISMIPLPDVSVAADISQHGKADEYRRVFFFCEVKCCGI